MANKTLAFEIGTEELPAFALHDATVQLPGLVAQLLEAKRIPHGAIDVYTTPRRLITLVADVPEATEASEEVFRGPAARIAFDADGNPTKAALGFARGKGVDASALELRNENGEDYVYAVKKTESRDVAALLPEVLLNTIEGISWPKSQRWGAHTELFSRPIRWILALLGETVVPLSYAGLESGRTTRGHRFLAPAEVEIACADDLLPAIRAAYVVPSEDEREASIRKQIAAKEAELGLVADLPAKTMAEVINLTEYPTVMVGTFDELFLSVPKEIIVDAMLMHQRYFPLFDQEGKLVNKFLITSNGDPAFEANIIDGNQRVVAARLYDAKFFYDEDLKKPLEDYVNSLDQVVFQEKLGTTLAKTTRVVRLAGFAADDAKVDAQVRADAQRAAYLAKADLVTGAVVEFTSVQGIMGSYYAKAAGETDEVANAIADHYRPRFAGDELPRGMAGRIVAFADKLDTITGLFAIGQAPTGSSDPFALRRAAIGIVGILNAGLNVSLGSAIDVALANYRADGLEFDFAEVKKAVVDFFVTRTKVILKDEGNASDAIDAVLACGVTEPAVIASRVKALTAAREQNRETMDNLAVAFARANNLRDPKLGTDCNTALFNQAEQNLYDAAHAASIAVDEALAADDYTAALGRLAELRQPVDAFFEDVMVMDEDSAVRVNRLKLLNEFVNVFANVADFGQLAKTK
ncbi:Glycine--tRNA ligase beta subunit [Slackia heliotrinireducens]|uniref:Glycine--tRNA ligase beta subunit n=1 Tax=Slackia heliotrinireducens (strain ATCC 29202 / DSM 20476 / NCTC 11029 / RHS 1) TaxID=471855 RepID=C7N5F3_SLAHD|nr:glycine--tRNA ligase subunit beta [Slackia heliotrinireducens]ACV22138.1 glycyl-tRNA synthetase, tetrameric type, beta subunit [Slackia heliotrinireducens DSM 20476]VEH00178.1 Glycine--tRNA ligase beta subunit [Slackia heliotrinireducens]